MAFYMAVRCVHLHPSRHSAPHPVPSSHAGLVSVPCSCQAPSYLGFLSTLCTLPRLLTIMPALTHPLNFSLNTVLIPSIWLLHLADHISE